MSSIEYGRLSFNESERTGSISKTPLVEEEQLHDRLPRPSEVKPNWSQRIIERLDQFEEKKINSIPKNFFQKTLDSAAAKYNEKLKQIEQYLEEKFTPVRTFFEQYENGNLIQKLAVFLAPLPFKAIRNIVKLLYGIITAALNAVVHPIKSLNKLVKLLVALVYQLTQPETWTKMGAGMVGASLGQAVVGNPLSVVGLIIGLAFMVGGISIGMLKAAIQADYAQGRAMAKQNFISQMKDLPEVFVTGFMMGLIIGAIEKAIYEKQKADFKPSKITSQEQANQYADQYIAENNLPQYSRVNFNDSGSVEIFWEGEQFNKISHLCEKVLDPTNPGFSQTLHGRPSFKINLKPEIGGYTFTTGYYWNSDVRCYNTHTLAEACLTQPSPAVFVPRQIATAHVSLVGATAAIKS